jgi:hypothetical protein
MPLMMQLQTLRMSACGKGKAPSDSSRPLYISCYWMLADFMTDAHSLNTAPTRGGMWPYGCIARVCTPCASQHVAKMTRPPLRVGFNFDNAV